MHTLCTPAISFLQGGEQQQAAAGEPNMPGISGRGSSVWDQSLDDLAQLPTCTKQLSLFSELQGLIARKRLRPVLSTAAQQLRFQMPFDPTLRITLETDVIMTSQVRTCTSGHERGWASASQSLRRRKFSDKQLQSSVCEAACLLHAFVNDSAVVDFGNDCWFSCRWHDATTPIALSTVNDWHPCRHGMDR